MVGLVLVAGPAALGASARVPVRVAVLVSEHVDETDAEVVAQVWQRALDRRATERGEDRRASRVAALGSSAIPAVVAVLRGEAVPPPGLELRPEQFAEVDAVLFESLAAFDAASVIAHCRARAHSGAEGFELFAARVFGRLEDERGLAELVQVVRDMDALWLAGRRTRAVLDEALAAQLLRDPLNFARLEEHARRCDPTELAALAGGIARTRSPRGVRTLSVWLGRDVRLDLRLLEVMDGALRRGVHAPSETVLADLRAQLRSPELAVQGAAAALLGRILDEGSLPALVDALEGESAALRRTARWSLRQLTGVDLGDEPDAWRSWYEHELDWWDAHRARLFEGLDGDDPARVHEVVVELLAHPLFRHETAAALGPLLLQPDAELVATTCAALLRLDSNRAVPWLVDALSVPHAERRDEVLATLQRLTGLDLPPSWRAWHALLRA